HESARRLPRTPVSWFRACATRHGFPARRSIPSARCRRIAAILEKVWFWIFYLRAALVATCSISFKSLDHSNVGSVLVKFCGTTKSLNVVSILLGLFLAHFVLCFFQIPRCP